MRTPRSALIMARDPKAAWQSTLLGMDGEMTAPDAKPVPTASSTTAKLIPDAINFGSAMPGKKGHRASRQRVPESGGSRSGYADVHRDAARAGNLKSMQ
jgi:hypothetical protein